MYAIRSYYAKRDALECMDIGGKRGFILAPGCDLAMATPIENLQAVAELVHDEVEQGEFVITSYSIHYTKLYDVIHV